MKVGTEYIGTSPVQRSADSSQPIHPQEPATLEDNEVQCILNNTKNQKRTTLEALKKVLFSEQARESKEPQLGKAGNAPSIRPEVQAQEEPPKEKLQLEPVTEDTERQTPRQEQRKTR